MPSEPHSPASLPPAPPPRYTRRRRRLTRWARIGWRLGVGAGVTLTLLIAGAWGAYAFLHGDRFLITDVAVSGVLRTPADAVQRLTRPAEGQNLWAYNTGDLRHRLEGLPWVASARVARQMPGTLKVTVTERVPAVLVSTVDGLLGVSAAGCVFPESAAAAAQDRVPRVYGAFPIRYAPGRPVQSPEVQACLRAADALHRAQLTVAELRVDGENLTVLLASGTMLAFGRATELEAKAVRARVTLDELHHRGEAAQLVDLRFPDAAAWTPRAARPR